MSAALPRALRQAGNDCRIVVPYYSRTYDNGHRPEPVLGPIEAKLGPHRLVFTTLEGRLPNSRVPVYFVHCPELFGRPGIYTQDHDEHLRFALLGWAALAIAQRLRFAPDIVHVNDWQTSLVPLILRTMYAWDRFFDRTRTVLTIHNAGHQGTFPAEIIPDLGLEKATDQFHQDQLREGRLSFLLTGILFSHAITTVSPTYAREIMTAEQGIGLDPFLRSRKDVVFGILNGIDSTEWNPTLDPILPRRYSARDLSGKEACRHELSRVVGLPYQPKMPRVCIVSRLAWQKGLDLCFDALPMLMRRRDFQLVVVGVGERRYRNFFNRLKRAAPHRVAFENRYTEPLAHLVEAGSDMLLMPSRYEPCGLNQMYSLAYGTPPIVHKTGGLADTVRLFDYRNGRGNGFSFETFDANGLAWALDYALDVWPRRHLWGRLMRNGMQEDHSWARRVPQYEMLYQKLMP